MKAKVDLIWKRWAWRYEVPLILMIIGWCLCRWAVAVLGMPLMVRGLRPVAVTVDRKGYLYVADMGNHCVWKMSTEGKLERVAGNGRSDYGGDGRKATKASLSIPSDIVVDHNGNLYIVDAGSLRIRKVSPKGVIITAAGGGQEGNSGDGRKAVQVWLPSPQGIAVDTQGNLYIIQTNNPRVRKVDRKGIITTVAGNGQRDYGGDGGPAVKASLSPSGGVAVDAEGNLYIADTGNYRIRKVDKTGRITTVAGNGRWGAIKEGDQAAKVNLASPYDVAIDAKGVLFIALHGGICKVDKTGIITIVAGGGKRSYVGSRMKALEAELGRVFSIAIDTKGNLYAVDLDNPCVIKVDRTGIIRTVLTAEGSRFASKKKYW